MAGEWRDNLDPWRTTIAGNRVYGRGTADNKGQHSINMSALRAVREARGGRLGFNAKFIIEMGEEIGSPDLRQVCEVLRDELKADLFSCLRRAAAFGGTSDDLPRLPRRNTDSSRCRICARAPIIPATGAACSPIPQRSLPARSRPWSTARAPAAGATEAAAAFQPDPRHACRCQDRADGGRAGAVAETGARKVCRPPSGSMPGTRSKCWRCRRAISKSRPTPFPAGASAVLQLRFVVGTRDRQGRRRDSERIRTATALRWSR